MYLVTVYIPTHNRVELLQRALNSVLSQTYSNLEIIIVDDGSLDGTQAYLATFNDNDRVICLRNETPQGACFSRNKAIAIASGEYITGLDDDDAFEPDRIRHLVQCMQEGDYSCVTASIIEHRSGGRLSRPHDTGLITLKKLLHSNKLGNQVLTKTEYLRAIGGFDEQLPAFQDYDTWVRLVAQFGPAYKLPNLDYIWYTDHELDRISNVPTKRLRAFELFTNKHNHLMNNAQRKSMALLKVKISGQRIGLFKLLSLTHTKNLRVSIAFFLNQYLTPIKSRIDKWRMS